MFSLRNFLKNSLSGHTKIIKSAFWNRQNADFFINNQYY